MLHVWEKEEEEEDKEKGIIKENIQQILPIYIGIKY